MFIHALNSIEQYVNLSRSGIDSFLLFYSLPIAKLCGDFDDIFWNCQFKNTVDGYFCGVGIGSAFYFVDFAVFFIGEILLPR